MITIDRPDRGAYFFKKLMNYKLQLYASPEYLSSSPPLKNPLDLIGHTFISYVNEILPAKGIPLITEIPYVKNACLRSSSLNVQKTAAQAGCGIALLPVFVIKEKEGLLPVFPDILSVTRTYWMMKSVELQKVEHVQRVWDIIAAQTQSFEEF